MCAQHLIEKLLINYFFWLVINELCSKVLALNQFAWWHLLVSEGGKKCAHRVDTMGVPIGFIRVARI